ncbi:MAG: hypothetical protein Q9188_006159, partial [Gyalolechia gomerana]
SSAAKPTDIYKAECLSLLTSIDSLHHFPFPYPIDRQIHGVLLTELASPAEFKDLTSTRAKASSTLMNAGHECSRLLAGVAKIFSSSSHEYSNHAFEVDIGACRKQLAAASSGLDELAKLYSVFGEEYEEYYSATKDAFAKGELGNREQFNIARRHMLRPLAGGTDPNQVYWAWKGRLRKMNIARSGVAALERDMQRLGQLHQMLQEMDRYLEHLANSVSQWDIDDSGPRTGYWKPLWHWFRRKILRRSYLSRSTRLTAWFQQHVLENSRLEKTWRDLLSSVDDGEPGVVMDIQLEWCD